MPIRRMRRPRTTTKTKVRTTRRRQPEEQIQMHLVGLLRKAGVRFFHVPNGSKATASYRAKLWSLGLEAGVPDLIIVDPTGRHPAAALELKAPRGRVSDAQKQWHADLLARGWAVATTCGLDEALAQLRAWGYLE